MATADEWAVKAHETIHASEVASQDYSTFDEAGNPLGVQVQVSIRQFQVDADATNTLDLKNAYFAFIEKHGDDAIIYFAKVIAGFTLKELSTKTGHSEWNVREAIERGRSEWGNALRRIGIRAQWR